MFTIVVFNTHFGSIRRQQRTVRHDRTRVELEGADRDTHYVHTQQRLQQVEGLVTTWLRIGP